MAQSQPGPISSSTEIFELGRGGGQKQFKIKNK